jgi:hypothetical protein
LSLRTHNDVELVYTGVMNDVYADTPLPKGTPIKIGLAEPYIPKSDKDEQEILIDQETEPNEP